MEEGNEGKREKKKDKDTVELSQTQMRKIMKG